MLRHCTAGLRHPGFLLWMLWGCAAPASAAPGVGHVGLPPTSASSDIGIGATRQALQASQPLFDFDIPAQSLDDALDRYASLTQRPALFSSETVYGRRSAAIRGRYSPAAALRLLLEGTGIVAEKIDTGPAEAFVLKESHAPVSSMQSALTGAGDYPGLVQARLWDALCGDARTVPGSYRALLRFRVDADGWIRQTRLLDTTGDTHRDAAVLEIFQRVRMDLPPPPAMPQPLAMIVLPRDADKVDAGLRCSNNQRSGAS